MTLPGKIWLPLAVGLVGLAGCAPRLSQAQLTAEAARVQTGPSIIAMQLRTPPAPGDSGMSGAEASVIWKNHLTQIGKPPRRSSQGGSQGGGQPSGNAGSSN
jgi:hypothetical protein